jgi:hypothetical protein
MLPDKALSVKLYYYRHVQGPRACLTFHHAGITIFIVIFLATPYRRHRLSQTTRQHNADIAKAQPCMCSARPPG